MTWAVVELRDVFCVHRTNEGDAAALQGTNLVLREGELLCVLGPSGAGKSTLLRVIAGIQPPSAGIVHVLGRDLARMPARARARLRNEQLGFVSQYADAVLPPDLPARDAVALPLALRGVPQRRRRARADALLERAGLSDRADAVPSELSGGERQQLALCAALAHQPGLLLADEPTGELDERSAVAMRALIAELARRDETSVIVASHDPATALLADRTVRIRDGRVVEEGRDGESARVISRGWIQLPAELLTKAGIGQRAIVREAQRAVASRAVEVTRARIDHTPPVPVVADEPRSAQPERGPARVEVHGLTRAYGSGRTQRTVIAGLTHAFAPGRLTVVKGPSGSGKTTLLRLIAGLDHPDSGRMLIDDFALEQQGPEGLAALRRERIGYLSQEPYPVDFLSATENVALALRVRGLDPSDAEERAAAAVATVGLEDRATQLVHRLSAGEAQRVALARALASARGLLIVDEPTSRLDEASARSVAALLARAATRAGQTVICATHDPDVIARADHVLALG
jgi:ABC-type lipoprotein export system ATPase subunit